MLIHTHMMERKIPSKRYQFCFICKHRRRTAEVWRCVMMMMMIRVEASCSGTSGRLRAWVQTRLSIFFSLILHKKRHEKKYKIIIITIGTSTHTYAPWCYTSIYIYFTAVFSLPFCDFSPFRDNSVLALHQFCVVFNSVFNLFFIVQIPKRSLLRNENGAKKKTISRFICLTFACAFATALRPCLFLSLSLRNSFFYIFFCFSCQRTDTHVNLFANLLATHHIICLKKSFAEVE